MDFVDRVFLQSTQSHRIIETGILKTEFTAFGNSKFAVDVSVLNSL